jgi:quinol monooxygenase YgiN
MPACEPSQPNVLKLSLQKVTCAREVTGYYLSIWSNRFKSRRVFDNLRCAGFTLEGMVMTTKGVKVTIFLSVKSDQVSPLLAMIPGLQNETLSRPGVRSTEALRNPATPTKLLFVDEFDSVEASEAYLQWRAQRGDLEKLGALLAEPPRIEVWPVNLAPT